MKQERKIGPVVLVSFGPSEIMVRKAGGAFRDTERVLATSRLVNGKPTLVVRTDVAAKFGVKVVQTDKPYAPGKEAADNG